MKRYCWSDNAIRCNVDPELQVWFQGPPVIAAGVKGAGAISCMSVCFGHLKPFIAAYMGKGEGLQVYKIVHFDTGQELWHCLANGYWTDAWYEAFIESYGGLRKSGAAVT